MFANILKQGSIAKILSLLLVVAATSAQATDVADNSASEHPSFSVKSSGNGPAIILIPGLSSPGQVWDETSKHYQEHYQCNVLTLAGFGATAPISEHVLKRFDADLERYIKDQHIEHPILLGHSLGGFLALRFAASHPREVGRVIVVDALPALAATQHPEWTGSQLEAAAAMVRDQMSNNYEAGLQAAAKGMVTSPEGVEQVVKWGMESDRTTTINAMYDMMSYDLRPDLGKIHVPVLVLGSWIAYKDYAPKAAIEGTYRAQYANLAGVNIIMSDTARHFIMMDDPKWMFETIDNYLKQDLPMASAK